MALTLGSFAGGLSSGLEEGEDLAQKRREDQQARVRQRAITDMEAYQRSQGAGQPPGGGPQPPPGAGGPVSGQGLPTKVALPGAQPMGQPMGQPGGQAPRPMGGPPAQGAPPGPQGGPPAAPMGQPAPMGRPPPNMAPQPAPAPPAPPGGQGQPPAGAGGQQPLDPMTMTTAQLTQQSLDAYRQVGQLLMKNNPGHKWEPGELFEATQLVMEATTKDADPIVKLTNSYTLAAAKLRYEQQKADADRESREGIATGREASQESIADKRDATQVQTTGMRDATQSSDTDKRDATQVQTTGMRDATSTGNTEARIAAGGPGGKAQKAKIAVATKTIDASIARIKALMAARSKALGGNVAGDKAYEQGEDQLNTLLAQKEKVIQGPASGQGDAGSQYHSADDVVKAYKNKDITYDQAHKILVDNGWAH